MTDPTSRDEKWVPQQRLTTQVGVFTSVQKRYYHCLRKQNSRSWWLFFSVILNAEVFTQKFQNLLLKNICFMLLFMLPIRREKRALISIINPPFTPVMLSQSLEVLGVEVGPEPGSTRTGWPMQAPQDSGDSALCPRFLPNSHDITWFQFLTRHSFILLSLSNFLLWVKKGLCCTDIQIHNSLRQTF